MLIFTNLKFRLDNVVNIAVGSSQTGMSFLLIV